MLESALRQGGGGYVKNSDVGCPARAKGQEWQCSVGFAGFASCGCEGRQRGSSLCASDRHTDSTSKGHWVPRALFLT